MPVSGLDHINLRAPRELMDRLRDFYCDIVGLQVGERPPFDSFGYWLYADGRPIVHLSESRRDAIAPSASQTSSDATYDHAAFACTDRTACERDLRERGIAYRVAEVPLTNQVQIFLRDPAGNGVELNFSDAKQP